MTCYICKNQDCNNIECRKILEIKYKYPDNTVVLDLLHKPDEFKFLIRSTMIAIMTPNRFNPKPSWEIDEKELYTNLSEINIQDLIETKFNHDREIRDFIGRKKYLILRFIVLSCLFKLHHTQLLYNKLNFNLYKVEHSEVTELEFLKNKSGTISYLYHGSPIGNWHSIMRNGIKVMSGTKDMTSGAAYGNGVYLTNLLQRSCTFAGTKDIIIGVYEVFNSDLYKKYLDIHVVPTNDLLLLRYLITLPDIKNIIELGDAMNNKLNEKAANKEISQSSKNKKFMARINKEIELLKKIDHNVVYIDNFIILKINDEIKRIKIPINFPIGIPNINNKDIMNWSIQKNIADVL